MSNIIGKWLDRKRTILVAGNRAEVVSAFYLTENKEDNILTGSPATTNIPVTGSTVVLYRALGDAEVRMFRWDTGVDMELGTDEVPRAKNAVETMLKMEGVNYV